MGSSSVEAAAGPDLLVRSHESLLAGMRAMDGLARGARFEEFPEGGLASRCDVPVPVVCVLFLPRAPPDPLEVLRSARKFFGRTTWWRCVTPASVRGDVVGPAEALRLKAGPGEPGMSLAPLAPAPPGPRKLRIEMVRDQDQLHDYHRVVGEAFSLPVFGVRAVLPRVPDVKNRETPAFRLLVGYEGDEPVASSAVVVSHRVASIYMVGTRGDFRNRGYGRAITRAAAEIGRQEGCTSAYLQATQKGRPMYEAMGFRKLTDYPEWFARPGPAGAVGGTLRLLALAFRRGG
ncbi:MAG: GNAT family N-acetyltransferase [Euryarchaeota archaeon]|nr:GNAT family N-acetyltransferase [Euryarchaeota archaeon]MDE1835914.1 GNAT family N-acetyltransferase [Euryarchaeota archaeon]MDE1880211.1 GNAT family N-acetyltransferase [Euryarchaeota archaeon]MDE2044408.1 GNAT family N-acetyltransferase [Thermoplasmata archaeon]